MICREGIGLFPSASSPTSSSEVGTNQVSTNSPSIEARLNQKVELVVSCIILEPEEEEEGMALNLMASFKERQCKGLSESLPTTPPPIKRTRLEVSHEDSISDAHTT